MYLNETQLSTSLRNYYETYSDAISEALLNRKGMLATFSIGVLIAQRFFQSGA